MIQNKKTQSKMMIQKKKTQSKMKIQKKTKSKMKTKFHHQKDGLIQKTVFLNLILPKIVHIDAKKEEDLILKVNFPRVLKEEY